MQRWIDIKFKKTDEKSRGAPVQEQPKKYELLLQCNTTKIEIYLKSRAHPAILLCKFINYKVLKYNHIYHCIVLRKRNKVKDNRKINLQMICRLQWKES